MGNFRSLLVWQKAEDLAVAIYQATREYQRDEVYGIVSQLRRASVSIPTNLAEGSGRQNRKETKHFANIALGSASEVESLLSLSKRLGFIDDMKWAELDSCRKEVSALLWCFYRKL